MWRKWTYDVEKVDVSCGESGRVMWRKWTCDVEKVGRVMWK